MLQLHYELDQVYNCCLSTSHIILRGHHNLQVRCDFWSAKWLILFNPTTIMNLCRMQICRTAHDPRSSLYGCLNLDFLCMFF